MYNYFELTGLKGNIETSRRLIKHFINTYDLYFYWLGLTNL